MSLIKNPRRLRSRSEVFAAESDTITLTDSKRQSETVVLFRECAAVDRNRNLITYSIVDLGKEFIEKIVSIVRGDQIGDDFLLVFSDEFLGALRNSAAQIYYR